VSGAKRSRTMLMLSAAEASNLQVAWGLLRCATQKLAPLKQAQEQA
jgi:hypothetical protein